MRIIRNREFSIELLVLLFVTVVAVTLAGYEFGEKTAICCLGVCGVFFMLFLGYSYRRYARMAKLAEQIDEILHGDKIPIMEHCYEGEMAILATGIEKMVQRLWEQQSVLEKEKVFLADSMADISHQMKTPLTSISLLLNLLQEEGLSTKKRMGYVQELMQLTNRIDWMVYALLRMAKLDAGTIQLQHKNYKIYDMIQGAVRPLEIPMDIRDITLKIDVDKELEQQGDITWMAEAIGNIIKNSMEHTPEKGKITVAAKDNPLYITIEIADTGSGFSKKDLPHIFERFYRGENADENSVGIGLALAKRIIKAQNGTIRAFNRKDTGGAVFEIRLYKGIV